MYYYHEVLVGIMRRSFVLFCFLYHREAKIKFRKKTVTKPL
jgi:hypothetical protein